MLKYPCLVLDHDDTVVQSEKTIGYMMFGQITENPNKTVLFENAHHWAELCNIEEMFRYCETQ